MTRVQSIYYWHIMRKVYEKLIQWFSKLYISRNKPYIVWITWSIWKTSCRMVVSQILQKSLPDIRVSTSPKNFNSEIWLALSILGITSFTPSFLGAIVTLWKSFWAVLFWSKSDVLILEYWIDAPWDMDVLVSICRPHCAIFTWLDKVHAESFSSPDDILFEKSKLLYAAKELVLYPTHATYLHNIIQDISVDVLSFWLQNGVESDIWFDGYSLNIDTWGRISTRYEIDQWKDDIMNVETNLMWEISAWYVSIAIQLVMILSNRLHIASSFPDVFTCDLQPWRRSLFTWVFDSILIDSTYNAAPESMKSAIRQAVSLRNEVFDWLDLVYCLWDMNELWDFSQQSHEEIAWLISQSAEHIFLTWQESYFTMQELQRIWFSIHRVTMCQDSRDMWNKLLTFLEDHWKKTLVLAKASQWWMYLEEALTQVVLDKDDIKKLPRQDSRRLKKKETFFATTN